MGAHLTVCTRGKPWYTSNNPSVDEIVETIDRLDGVVTTNLVLVGSLGYLFINASPEGRMHVAYSGMGPEIAKLPDPINAYLIDKTQPESPTLEFRWENGQADDWPMRQTVSREVAKDVASYFLQHNAFPKGLDWEGNMVDFDVSQSDDQTA